MSWFLIKAEYVMDDGRSFSDSTWVEGDDWLEAAEQARKDRQWDLRSDGMRVAEFEQPAGVRYVRFEGRKYNVRQREIMSFDLHYGREISNIEYGELPGATREDIAALPQEPASEGIYDYPREPDWRDVDEAGDGFAR